jgi:hypothetical protein
MSDLAALLAAAARARALVADLDHANRPVDRHQVAAGVGHELDTILRGLHEALQERREAVAGHRDGKVRSDAPATSRAAARQVLRSGTNRFRVLETLAWLPATDHELQHKLGMDPSTERPRRGELVDEGFVVESGRTKRHKGRDWTVWRVTEAGRAALIAATGNGVPAPPEVVADGPQPTLF